MPDSFSSLSSLLAVLVALSAASQRLVDIVKGFDPSLSTEQTDAAAEKKRKLKVQGIAIGAGILTALLAMWAGAFPVDYNAIGKVLVLGLMASGGSSFWSSMLGYVNGIKDIKQKEVIATDVKVKSDVVQAAKVAAAKPGMQLADTESPDLTDAQKKALTDAQTNLEVAIKAANSKLRLG